MTDSGYLIRRVTTGAAVAILSLMATCSFAIKEGNDTRQVRNNNATRLCLKSDDPRRCASKLDHDLLQQCEYKASGEREFADCIQKVGIHG